ncbi:hypothetical protein DV515_00013545 [Chloebia gouldiae]|uniref:Uncharacterized protein n=1 Tax=Chloebia gouldiae TaxID=44316 RepID=A0A3L8S1M3_CHLGU|nr:hypothetical protein DV515_00013545 [Chloebia gouldiae]
MALGSPASSCAGIPRQSHSEAPSEAFTSAARINEWKALLSKMPQCSVLAEVYEKANTRSEAMV